MFPKINLVAHSLKLLQHAVGIGKFILVPSIGTGVGVRLPAGLKTEDITRDTFIAKLFGKPGNMLLISRHISAVENTQSPYGKKSASSAE